jgi:hypothetical protein
MNNEFARSVTNFYTTIATTYMDTAAKMYQAQVSLMSDLAKVDIKNIWTQKS